MGNVRRVLRSILMEEYQLHDTLNPKLWDEDARLKPEIEDKLQEIISTFSSFLEEHEVPIKPLDAWIVGSNASYNYTDKSDLDLHIIVDSSVSDCAPLLLMVYNAYRSLFNSSFDISLNGVPVEVYVEDLNSSVQSNGIYSINKGWIKSPTKNLPLSINTDEWDHSLSTSFKEVMSHPSIESIDELIDKVYILRKEGIASQGEYSPKNQAFKNFRDAGHLQALKDKRNELISKRLSK